MMRNAPHGELMFDGLKNVTLEAAPDGHPHGRTASWFLAGTVLVEALAAGVLGRLLHIDWLVWSCLGVAGLGLGMGAVLWIMNDIVVRDGPSPAAQSQREHRHEGQHRAAHRRSTWHTVNQDSRANTIRSIRAGATPATSSRGRHNCRPTTGTSRDH